MPERSRGERDGRRLIIGGAWNDGALPAPTPNVHVLAGRDGQGLGIAACGLRQEHRSNGWFELDRDNEYQAARLAAGDWPECPTCKTSD